MSIQVLRWKWFIYIILIINFNTYILNVVKSFCDYYICSHRKLRHRTEHSEEKSIEIISSLINLKFICHMSNLKDNVQKLEPLFMWKMSCTIYLYMTTGHLINIYLNIWGIKSKYSYSIVRQAFTGQLSVVLCN